MPENVCESDKIIYYNISRISIIVEGKYMIEVLYYNKKGYIIIIILNNIWYISGFYINIIASKLLLEKSKI